MRALIDKSRKDLYALLALLLLCSLPFIDLLAGINTLFIRDLTRYYYPTKRIIREIILGGEFPYWNPYYSAGQPMAANPEYEVFYPPQWLILLPSYDLGYRLHIFIHIYIAAAGMYLLLRSMRMRISSAAFGSVSWALGGFYLSLVNLLPILFAAAWIPLIALFARRFLGMRRAGDFALASLMLGMQALAGEPTTMLQTWFLILCYAIARGWSGESAPAIEGPTGLPETLENVDPAIEEAPPTDILETQLPEGEADGNAAGDLGAQPLDLMTEPFEPVEQPEAPRPSAAVARVGVGGRLRRILVNLVAAGGMIAGGLAVGAAQFFPAVDHVFDSVRSRPFDYSLVTAWSMPYARPLELIFPAIFGHIDREGTWYWGSGLYPNMGSPFIFAIYPGLMMTVLLVGGFVAKIRGKRLVLFLTFVSILLALGGHTPLFRFLYDGGMIRSIRYPEKFTLIAIFALTVFAARVFDHALDGNRRVLDAAAGFAGAIALFSAVVSGLTFTPYYGQWLTKIWSLTPANSKYLTTLSGVDWYVATVRAVIVLALILWLRFRGRQRFGLWAAITACFLLADLTYVTREVVPRMPSSFLQPPPIARTLQGDRRGFRIFHEADWYGGTQIARSYFSTRDAVYWIVRNGLYPMTPASFGFRTVLERDYDKTALLRTVDLVDAMWKVRDQGQKEWAEIFMAMSNARYRSRYRTFESESKRVGGRHKVAQPIDFTTTAAPPRYYFADQLVTVRGNSDFIKRLVKERWSRSVAFVEFPAFPPAAGMVSSVSESANSARLEVRSSGKGFLVMSVTPHKYWRATIDGRSSPLQVVNIGYQGIVIPPGRHVIEMRYRNWLVDLCVVISILSIAIVGVVVARSREGPALHRRDDVRLSPHLIPGISPVGHGSTGHRAASASSLE